MRAYYDDTVKSFLQTDNTTIIGTLTNESEFDVTKLQRDAWNSEIDILKNQLKNYKYCHLFLEFNIPRMGSRIDALLFIPTEKPHIIVMEFKVGTNRIESSDKNQVIDYALELKNFHKSSHNADIYSVLIPTEITKNNFNLDLKDGISKKVSVVKPNSIGDFIKKIEYKQKNNVNVEKWENSPYKPTPTIIEAARALWENQNVDDITRSEGGATNISKTSKKINELIDDAKKNKKKKIIFVTGVPGAGKTLVGLNIAAERREKGENHAVFLSGNAPLVKVLQESLVRDDVKKNNITKGEAGTKVKSFIQIVHHYRDESIRNNNAPSEHIAIFDEAQRLWNERELSNFMKRKKGVQDFNKSEGHSLIEYLDRHKDWAVCICLVGGGQEINKGEAGISSWVDAAMKFPKWEIYISSKLTDSEYKLDDKLYEQLNEKAKTDESLHLSVSLRSFRSEKVSNFVKALLDINDNISIPKDYPIVITRSLSHAKQWVRKKARGSERYGILASSKALRLKPFAIDVKSKVDPVHYFLNSEDDPRSSYFLESAASEFETQGLELDYSIVCWDGDFRMKNIKEWEYHDFKGGKWTGYNNTENEPNRQDYLKNAYRVLLTRARQGMVVFVPLGNYPPDKTRKKEFYDNTYEYLKNIGLKEIGTQPFDDKGY